MGCGCGKKKDRLAAARENPERQLYRAGWRVTSDGGWFRGTTPPIVGLVTLDEAFVAQFGVPRQEDVPDTKPLPGPLRAV